LTCYSLLWEVGCLLPTTKLWYSYRLSWLKWTAYIKLLALKLGCSLILLHNIDPMNSLYNRTKLILLAIKIYVLEYWTLDRKTAGNTVSTPRISPEPLNKDLPISLSHQQFSVHLAFVITINKSQGQLVRYIGLDLWIYVFSHGQLYVTLSYCISRDRIKVLFLEVQHHKHNQYGLSRSLAECYFSRSPIVSI
jgi:hypothetical protein